MFTPKAWANFRAGATPVNADALSDLEQRVYDGAVTDALASLTSGGLVSTADLAANGGSANGQIRLDTIGGKAWLRFGTDGTDETDSTSIYRNAAGELRTNTYWKFDGGFETPSVAFQGGSSAVIAASGTDVAITGGLGISGGVGFNGSSVLAKPTVTGSRGGNAALASVLTALASYGLITNSSS